MVAAVMAAAAASGADWRDVRNGRVIPDEGYCDQPYVVVLDDGTWLCTMTTGTGVEGAANQHIVSTRSTDQGVTWGPLVNIEPPEPPEASWVTPLKVPGNRVYAFYTYNADNLRSVKLSSGGETKRVDTLGQFVFKFSGDGGQTWSAARYTVPVREFAIDRENVYGGLVRFMWSVAKPLVVGDKVYIGLSKVGNFGQGFIERSEGVVLVSPNLLTESEPSKITWETLPAGDIGLRAPAGPIAEEQNLTFLSDGALFCTYRTTQGHPSQAYSHDGGKSWTPPAYMTYSPGGRFVKHPRAANFVRRFSNGKYLYWFHNNGGRTYDGRNPAWISGGVEKDGAIYWSQPEVLLYDPDPTVRMSYPDFIEDKGRLFVTETQKTVARVHEIPRDILDGVWSHLDAPKSPENSDAIDLIVNSEIASSPQAFTIPAIAAGNGFTIEARLKAAEPAEYCLLDTRDAHGNGIVFGMLASGSATLSMAAGGTTEHYESDPMPFARGPHNVSVIIDGGPRIALFVVDGVLSDGGEGRDQGWFRVGPDIVNVNGKPATGSIMNAGRVAVSLRFYPRALRVNEVIEHQRAAG